MNTLVIRGELGKPWAFDSRRISSAGGMDPGWFAEPPKNPAAPTGFEPVLPH